MDQLCDGISTLLESGDSMEILRGLRAVDDLIDASLGEGASKVSRLSSYLRTVFETKRDPDSLIAASGVLGHLAWSGGAMTADEVERQVKTALDCLRGDRVEYRRFAAVLILKEMAENAPTVFNVRVPEFIDLIWVALRDPSLAVRERAVEALRACLRVIEKSETRWQVEWNTGEFMMSRYREVADIVLKYLEHRDRLVRLSITSLLPRIAHFLRDRFVTNYLKGHVFTSRICQQICMGHILAVLRIPAERASGFIALGEMIAPRRGKQYTEALACVGSFAKAMGPAMEPYVLSLMDGMFSSGLLTTLVEALEQYPIFTASCARTLIGLHLCCTFKNPLFTIKGWC